MARIRIEMTRCGFRLVERATTPTGFASQDFKLIGNYATLREAKWLYNALKDYGFPPIDYLNRNPPKDTPKVVNLYRPPVNRRVWHQIKGKRHG